MGCSEFELPQCHKALFNGFSRMLFYRGDLNWNEIMFHHGFSFPVNISTDSPEAHLVRLRRTGGLVDWWGKLEINEYLGRPKSAG